MLISVLFMDIQINAGVSVLFFLTGSDAHALSLCKHQRRTGCHECWHHLVMRVMACEQVVCLFEFIYLFIYFD